jgi:CoA:oxalate CoA-transferase
MVTRALADIKVIEYGHEINSAHCGKMLADMGAEVIKIEDPECGDAIRKIGPFPDDIPDQEKSGLFLYLNSNKLGITINMKTSLGMKIFKDLLKNTDVFVESNAPQHIKNLGLDYQTLRETNIRLIMTSITPFGQTGPYKDYKGNDLIISNLSGHSYLTPGDAKGPQCPPLKVCGHQSDFLAGAHAAAATLCAVYARSRTGMGQHIDISSLEANAARTDAPILFYTMHNAISTRYGVKLISPIGRFPCKNGYINIHCVHDKQWQALAELIDADWTKSEVFGNPESRGQNADILHTLISEWTMQYTKEDLYKKGQANGVPLAPFLTMEDLFSLEYLKNQRFFVELDHPRAGLLKYPGAPYRFSKTPWQIQRPAPLLGEHNEEVYCKRLGYTRQDLIKMREGGII